jgi:hypothetical protein
MSSRVLNIIKEVVDQVLEENKAIFKVTGYEGKEFDTPVYFNFTYSGLPGSKSDPNLATTIKKGDRSYAEKNVDPSAKIANLYNDDVKQDNVRALKKAIGLDRIDGSKLDIDLDNPNASEEDIASSKDSGAVVGKELKNAPTYNFRSKDVIIVNTPYLSYEKATIDTEEDEEDTIDEASVTLKKNKSYAPRVKSSQEDVDGSEAKPVAKGSNYMGGVFDDSNEEEGEETEDDKFQRRKDSGLRAGDTPLPLGGRQKGGEVSKKYGLTDKDTALLRGDEDPTEDQILSKFAEFNKKETLPRDAKGNTPVLKVAVQYYISKESLEYYKEKYPEFKNKFQEIIETTPTKLEATGLTIDGKIDFGKEYYKVKDNSRIKVVGNDAAIATKNFDPMEAIKRKASEPEAEKDQEDKKVTPAKGPEFKAPIGKSGKPMVSKGERNVQVRESILNIIKQVIKEETSK